LKPPSAKPIEEDQKARYLQLMEEYKKQLDEVKVLEG
jgi:hypothetical protein